MPLITKSPRREIATPSPRPALPLLLLAVLLAAPAAVAQETAAPAQQPPKWSWPERAENLKVLPADFPPQRLRAVMTGFSRSLGVRCSHCHMGEEGKPLATYDFASDANPKKAIARLMLEMLGDINKDLEKIETQGGRVNMWCHTCHRGRPRPATLDEELLSVFKAEGSAAGVARYRELRERFYGRGAYDFGERSLNSLGYRLLGDGDTEAAIAVFRLNAEQFPASGNAWDSLAEAYATKGQKELAAVFYRKSLELDPDNANALEKLRQLRGGEE